MKKKYSDEIVVIGHRNPDTDSVAASYALAELKKSLGIKNVVAARAGLVSERTEYLFKKFNTPLPQLKVDVYPRVRNIMDRDFAALHESSSLFEGIKMLERAKLSRIPVVDRKNHYKGMLSIFSLLDSFLHIGNNKNTALVDRNVISSLNLIIDVLEGEAVSLFDEKKEQNFSVFVAAMNEASFSEHVPADKPEELAIIVGDRTNIHLKAIHLGIRLIIVTGSKEIDPVVLQAAKDRRISIIKTPFDSATVVRRLKLSCPIGTLIQDDVPKFRMEDALSDIRHVVFADTDDIFPVVNRYGDLIGTFARVNFDNHHGCKLILVDHNEYEQSVKGIEQVQVVEIVDHHRLNLPPQTNTIKVTSDIVGSTCTLVGEMFLMYQQAIPKNVAGILQGGIIADTLLLRSPTATERDAAILRMLEKISGVKSEELMKEIFQLGSVIVNKSPRELFATDCKTFKHLDNYIFSIAQVEELGFNEFYNKKSEIVQAAKLYTQEEHLDFFGLLVTDVQSENSLLLLVGDHEILENIPYKKLEDNLYDLPGILSRKKQLLPQILKLLDTLK
ncbi:MAG: putative manganese-dependent inorganic diphosphatase [Lentisphaeria bacterium]|nr:putative manganese-dependent inorganic diphosphatase [Lentisphaeria bacterium]